MGRHESARQLPLPNVLSEAQDARVVASLRDHLQTVHPADRPASAPLRSGHDSDLSRSDIERRLTFAVGAPLTVTITDNRRTMLSIRRRDGVRCVRLHRMFLDAPSGVVEAVGRYVAHEDRRACTRIDQYIAANRWRIQHHDGLRSVRTDSRGGAHDLIALRNALAGHYFGADIEVAITWGRSATGLRGTPDRRTIRMGAYFVDERLIRIHPALDRAWVPEFFVAWVIYHEMLHHVVPMPLVNGRRCYHTPEFRERERLFADGDRAREWERTNLHRLIAARDG